MHAGRERSSETAPLHRLPETSLGHRCDNYQQFIVTRNLKTHAENSHAHIFLHRERVEVRLGPVYRPFMNSDEYRFQILLFQIDVLTLSSEHKSTKMCPKYPFDLSSDLIVSEPNTDRSGKTIFKF